MTIRRHLLALAAGTFACGSTGSEPPTPAATVPAAMREVGGNGQTAATSTALPALPTVEVLDSAAQPLRNVNVLFNVIDGDGWVVADRGVTDARGRASNRTAFATALVTSLDAFLGNALPARKSP